MSQPPILRLQHVSLPIPGEAASLAEARHYSEETLGLAALARPPALPGAGLWYAVGSQELHLFEEASGVAANDQSRRHPCFQVEDATELRRHLEGQGVPTRDDDGEIPGRPRFFAIDPFGNTLEFVAFEADHW